MSLRVTFVSHSLPPLDRPDTNIGGMQRVALELHRALSVHPDIVYTPLVMRATWAETHRRVSPFLLRTLRDLRRQIRRDEVDAILFSSMVTASLDTLLAGMRRKAGIKSAAIVHGLDVTTDVRLYQAFVPRVFGALDAVMPVSNATGDACLSRGLPRSKLFVVPNGVDADRFSFPAAPDFSAKPSDRPSLVGVVDADLLAGAGLVLCSVGRHVERKGFDWFVANVMPQLPDDVIYVIVGEGPASERIRKAANAAGVEARVALVGRVSEDELQKLYAGADLFVMPNVPVAGDMEGFGVVMLEAGLSGAPAIAAGIEGILDVISPGENGTLVPTGDAAAFTAAIMRYHGRHDLVVEAAKRARDYTIATFGWTAVADRYVEGLAALVEGRGSRLTTRAGERPSVY